MKYIILTVIAVVAVFGVCFLISGRIRSKMKKKIPMFFHIVINLLSGTVMLMAVGGIYLSIHYSADSTALALLDDESVHEVDGAYFVDGKGEDTVLIFYPGAKVDSEAYLPLMKQLADNGIDCFIIRPPFRFALFDMNAADRIIESYHYQQVLVGGHSMGGIAAASYASRNPDQVDGVILLSGYPNTAIRDDIPVLSIYGSEDHVLEQGAYQNAQPNFPADSEEIIIGGGNHAGFGNYGEQNGDGKATVSRQQQQKQTVNAILDFQKEYLG